MWTLAPFQGTPMHSEGDRHPQAGTTGKAELPGDHSLTPGAPEHHALTGNHSRYEITLTCLTPAAMHIGYCFARIPSRPGRRSFATVLQNRMPPCCSYTRATRRSYPPIPFTTSASHWGCEGRLILEVVPWHKLNSPPELPTAPASCHLQGNHTTWLPLSLG